MFRENIPFPSVARPLPRQELERRYQDMAVQGGKGKKPMDVIFYGDDWSTRGDWCHRHGRDYAMLCAANAPWNNVEYFNSLMSMRYECVGTIGPNQRKDALRHWVETINDKGNRNVLVSPDYCIRTEAEWDDHGEDYPQSFDGPDVWIAVKVPEGRHMLSVYFYNPNGRRSANNALRDYLVEVRKMITGLQNLGVFYSISKKDNDVFKACAEHAGAHLVAPVLARTRVSAFSGAGVYKSFLVQGPGAYYIRVSRNHSFNTIVNGVFMTCLAYPDRSVWDVKSPGGMFNRSRLRDLLDVPYPGMASFHGKPSPFLSVDDVRSVGGIQDASRYHAYLLDLLRAQSDEKRRQGAEPVPEDQVKWCLNIRDAGDERLFDDYLTKLWERHQELYPFNRSAEWAEYSPNVISFSVDEVKAMEKMNVDWKQYLPGGNPAIPREEMKAKIRLFMNKTNKT